MRLRGYPLCRRAGFGPLLAVTALAAGAPGVRAEERSCTETLVRMSDGVRLHAWVSRLGPDRARPVLFMMDSYARSGRRAGSPAYDNACPGSLPDDYVPAYLSPDVIDRFTLVQVSYRGTGSSEGLFDLTGRRTQRDLREAIAWAAREPWSTGRIVLVGESGTGFVAHHGLREPSVAAAVIFTSCADMYRCMRRGGVYNGLADVYLAGTSAGYLGGLRARTALGTMANPAPARQVAAITGALAHTKTEGANTAWWRERSSLDALGGTSTPVMYTTDPYDIVQPFDALQRTPGARLNLGMGHLAPPAAAAGGERYAALVRAPVDRFVAHYGLGEENGAEREPRVTLVTGTGSLAAFQAGNVLVRSERAWPLPSTSWTRLSLARGRTLSSQPPALGPAADVAPLASGARPDLRSTAWALGRNTPTDLRAEETAGLTYTTPVLRRDLEVTGPITARLFASTTARDFDWSVRIADVWPDGRSEWITDGYLRASLRRVDPERSLRDAHGAIVRPWHTFDRPEPVPFGRPVEYLVDVIGTSNVFRAGHRLRLDVLPVASAGVDSIATGGAGAVRILRDPEHPSSLTLPIVPDGCARSEPLTEATPRIASCASSYDEAVAG